MDNLQQSKNEQNKEDDANIPDLGNSEQKKSSSKFIDDLSKPKNQSVGDIKFNIPANNEAVPSIPTMNEHAPESKVLLKKDDSKLKSLLIIFSGFLVFLITILGISLFKGDLYWLRDMVGLGMPSNPDKAYQKVISNTSLLKSVKSDFKAEMKISKDTQAIIMAIEGNQTSDYKAKMHQAHFKLKNVDITDGGSPTDFDSSSIPNIEGSIISSQSELFFQVNSLFGDQWHKIDLNKMMNATGISIDKTNDINYQSMIGALVYSNQKVATSGSADIIKSAKRLEDEKSKEGNQYHYQIEFDLVKILEQGAGFTAIPEFQRGMIKDFVNKYIELKFDVFVFKKNFVVKKIKTNLDFKLDSKDLGSEGIFKANIAVEQQFKDFDKTIIIEKPKDAVDFDPNSIIKLLEGFDTGLITGEGSEDSGNKYRNTQRRADLLQVKTALEVYYAEHKSYPILTDNSKDGIFLNILKDEGFLEKLPLDPSHPKYYYFYESTDGKTYNLTGIEETKDGFTLLDMSQK